MRKVRLVLLVVVILVMLNFAMATSAKAGNVQGDARRVAKSSLDFRSMAREIADEVRVLGLNVPPGFEGQTGQNSQGRIRNVQVNDPALDHVTILPGTRPYEFSIQSETSVAAFGDTILVGYNSAADQPVVSTPSGPSFIHRHLSGFSLSHDGGQSWTSGFVPAVPGSPFTFGDPAVGVDRAGNFYYAALGTDGDSPRFSTAIIINKFTNRGNTVSPASVVALDDGADKDWFAIGPDPSQGEQDNLYVAWTSFQNPTAANPGGSSQLRFAKSTNGGATWSAQKILFAPNDASGGTDPTVMSSFIQFANPVVDASSGRLFIPFLHFSNTDADLIKVLVSNDAGETFRFVKFNVPGALDPFGVPNVTPGTLSDCGAGNGGLRLVLHQGPELGGGRFGLPRFRQATRLTSQPSAAAAEGNLFIAFPSSTSPSFGDPTSRSEIRLLFSSNGGRSFAQPVTIAAASDADPQHILPAISVDESGQAFDVAYYVQQADGRIRVDLTNGVVDGGGRRLSAGSSVRVSRGAFDLIPSNNPFPIAGNPFFTTNYDRTIRACYDLGEYLSNVQHNGAALLAWGDDRNSWTSPTGSPAAGRHSQPDVFFQTVSL